jgi:DNA adenine methylase
MGAKRRLTSQIAHFLPNDTKEICSPFCGGCSFELALAEHGIEVHASDISELLIEFWQDLKSEPNELADLVLKYFIPLPSTTYYWAKDTIKGLEPNLFRSAMFYAINRASFSGSTLDGGMEPGHPALTVDKVKDLRKVDLSKMHFVCLSFEEQLSRHKDIPVYLDPPYFGVDLSFGEGKVDGKNFDHLGLYKILSKRNSWILSYDNHPTVLQLYAGYKIVYPEITYSTRSSSGTGSRDVLIISNDY